MDSGEPMEGGGEIQQISSSSTNFWKWVFGPAWMLVLGGFIAAGWMGLLDRPPSEDALVLLTVLWVGLGTFFLAWASRLEHLWLTGDELLVRRLGREVRVPLSRVEAITETRWSRVKTVTITLEPGHPIGDKIVFVPPWRPLPFLDHPLVKDLYRRKSLAGSRYASLPELL
jgi:hypothetical protein